MEIGGRGHLDHGRLVDDLEALAALPPIHITSPTVWAVPPRPTVGLGTAACGLCSSNRQPPSASRLCCCMVLSLPLLSSVINTGVLLLSFLIRRWPTPSCSSPPWACFAWSMPLLRALLLREYAAQTKVGVRVPVDGMAKRFSVPSIHHLQGWVLPEWMAAAVPVLPR
jgi:hypothetical protein